VWAGEGKYEVFPNCPAIADRKRESLNGGTGRNSRGSLSQDIIEYHLPRLGLENRETPGIESMRQSR